MSAIAFLTSQATTTVTKPPDILFKNMSFISPTETRHCAARNVRHMAPEVEQIMEELITFSAAAKTVTCCIYKSEVD